MHPTFKQVPPNSLSFSTRAVFNPSCPDRIAATYPPGPEPMITTSNFSITRFYHSKRSEESLIRSSAHDKALRLKIQRQFFRILDALLHFDEESNGFFAVD